MDDLLFSHTAGSTGINAHMIPPCLCFPGLSSDRQLGPTVCPVTLGLLCSQMLLEGWISSHQEGHREDSGGKKGASWVMTERGPAFYLQMPAARPLLPGLGVSGLTVPGCEGRGVQHVLGVKMLVEGQWLWAPWSTGDNFRETLSHVCWLRLSMSKWEVGKMSLSGKCAPQEEGRKEGQAGRWQIF